MAHRISFYDSDGGYIWTHTTLNGLHIVSVCEQAAYFIQEELSSAVKAVITSDETPEREVIHKKDLDAKTYFKYKIEYDKVCRGTEEGVLYEHHHPWVNYANSLEKLESFKNYLNVIGGRAINIKISKI